VDQHERPIFALILRLASALLFATMFMLVKLAGERGAHLPEIMFWRQGIAAIVMLAWLLPARQMHLLKTENIGRHVARTGIGMIGMIFGFSAVTLLPLAEATMLGFTAPLFAVLITALVVRDRVGPWRWSAVVVGFAGVLIITQPGNASLSALGLAAGLGAALVVAIVSFQIKSLARIDGPTSVAFYFSLFGALVTAPFLPFYFTAHNEAHWLILIGCGLAGALGQLLASFSLRHGAVATVMIMDYTSLIWATLFGYFVFDRLPPYAIWIGAPIIIMAGMIVMWREHRLSRAVPPAIPQDVD